MPEENLGIRKKQDLKDAMLSSVVVAGSSEEARRAGVAEEASREGDAEEEAAAPESDSVTKEEKSPAENDCLVGDANGLSGRLCSALSWKSPSSLGLVNSCSGLGLLSFSKVFVVI